MASVSTYLNFARSTEEAFNFYRSVFGTEFEGKIMRFGDMPAAPGQPPISESDKKLVMHISLPILGGHRIMGTDAPESMGFNLNHGNNVYINLSPDTRAEADGCSAHWPRAVRSRCRSPNNSGATISAVCVIASECNGCSIPAARPDQL